MITKVNETNETIRLAASGKNRAAEILTAAFLEDPLYQHLFPDTAERSSSLRRLFGAVVGYTLKYGIVHTTSSVDGVACWLTPGNTKITFWRMLRTGLEFQRAVSRLRADARSQMLEAMAYMDEIHNQLMAGPDRGSHWYLWALGVSPPSQGQGLGAKLIQPVLTRSDLSNYFCYLETLNERNVVFYQRWGFDVSNETIVPGVELRVWSMIREPYP